MPRTSRSPSKRARHKKWIKRAKGYRGRRSQIFKLAKEAVLKAGQYSYQHRRKKKGDFRRRWHVQINAGARQNGISYSRLMHGMRTHNIALNRKVLATLAQEHSAIFTAVADAASKPVEKK